MSRKYLFSTDGRDWSLSDWGPIDTIISGQQLQCFSSTSFPDGPFEQAHSLNLIPDDCVPFAYFDMFKCGTHNQEDAFHLYVIKMECKGSEVAQAGMGGSFLPTLIVGALGLGAIVYLSRKSKKSAKNRM